MKGKTRHLGDHNADFGETYLPGSVDYLSGKILASVFELSAERVFNRRIVTLDKMAFDELNSKGRFACVLC